MKKTWNVYLPVCYYEVFVVEADNKSDAIGKVKLGTDNSIAQNCTLANQKWSRRIFAIETDEKGTEK